MFNLYHVQKDVYDRESRHVYVKLPNDVIFLSITFNHIDYRSFTPEHHECIIGNTPNRPSEKHLKVWKTQ